MASIRVAERDDLPRVVALIMERAKEFKFMNFPKPDINVVADTVYKNYMLAPCFVMEIDGKIVGCASLTLTSFGWSKQVILAPFMVYIQKAHRSLKHTKAIYKAIQEYADEWELLYVDDYIATDRIEARQRLMRGMGFDIQGFMLTYKGEY